MKKWIVVVLFLGTAVTVMGGPRINVSSIVSEAAVFLGRDVPSGFIREDRTSFSREGHEAGTWFVDVRPNGRVYKSALSARFPNANIAAQWRSYFLNYFEGNNNWQLMPQYYHGQRSLIYRSVYPLTQCGRRVYVSIGTPDRGWDGLLSNEVGFAYNQGHFFRPIWQGW